MSRNYEQMTPDPTYVEVWNRAVTDAPLSIPVKTKAQANRLRYNLYHTRKILMAKAGHEHLSAFSISIVKDFTVLIDTTDLEIKESLAAIGIGSVKAPDLEDL